MYGNGFAIVALSRLIINTIRNITVTISMFCSIQEMTITLHKILG